MKRMLGAAALSGLLVFAAQARSGGDSAIPTEPAVAPAMSWSAWSQTLAQAAPSAPGTPPAPAPDIDVVDAHWMALTMWGEARGSGEEAMRAVGHVIDNRRRTGGAFVTDTVSEAWQFSCWNPGDPNRRAIETIGSLPPDSRDALMWRAAGRIAEEILSGHSDDPTGRALFYHAASVAPAWSRGVPPAARIGGHLFFLTAR